MTSTAVIEIPLLAARIYHHLPVITRKACLCVNRSWNAALLPLLYKSIKIPALSKNEVVDAIIFGISLHGHLVRELDLSSTFELPVDAASPEKVLAALATHCEHLRFLKIKLLNASYWPQVKSLLHHNPRLTELHYHEAAAMDQGRSLPELFAHSASLEKLTIHPHSGITVGDLMKIGRSAPRLSELYVQHRIWPDKTEELAETQADENDAKNNETTANTPATTMTHSTQNTPTFSVLRYLRSTQSNESNGPLEQVIRQCPNLETLRLFIGKWFKMSPIVHALGHDRVCPHLTTIEFDGSLQNAEQDLIRVIRGLPPMQSIKLDSIDATQPFLKALVERHASELRTLKLLNLNQCSDEGISEMLVRSTKLEQLLVVPPPSSFGAPPQALDARVLLASPWGCKNLNWMYLPVGYPVGASVTPTERQTIQDDEPFIALERQYFKQLGELRHLRYLFPEGDLNTSIGFSWTLARGLGQTSTLTALKYLSLRRQEPFAEAEKDWIEAHWPSIEMYSG